MTEFEIARLQRLPQREGEVWQGGWCRLPFPAAIAGATHDGRRARLAVWASPDSDAVSEDPELCDVEEIDAAGLLSSLVRFACDRRLAGYRPGRVQVCDEEMAAGLRGPLGLAHIVVEVVSGPADRLPAIAPVLDAMRRDLARPDDGGASLSTAEGVTIDRLRAFADAAREFALARPWERLSGDDDPLRVVAPALGPGRGAACVLGSAGQHFGLAFFDSLADWLALVRSHGTDDNPARRRAREQWVLNLVPFAELTYEDGQAWRRHDLPVADEDSYPLLLHQVPARGLVAPGPADLARLEGLLRALARASDDELDAGRWSASVPTADGPARCELELPELLSPPSREEMIARGWEPDPRAGERLGLIISRQLDAHPVASLEEADAILRNLVGGRALPDIPFAPRDAWERAQELCYQAFDAQGRRRTALARRALAICPDCADARVLLAEDARDPQARLAHYAAGAAAGLRALDEQTRNAFPDDQWGHVRARGRLRALWGQAVELRESGRHQEAIAVARELLSLDRADHLRIRTLLMGAYLETDRMADLAELLTRFDPAVEAQVDGGAWAWAAVLAAFRLHGPGPEAESALATARAVNRHVQRFLNESPAALERAVTTGNPDAFAGARVAAAILRRFWAATPAALEWLARTKSRPPRNSSPGHLPPRHKPPKRRGGR